MKEKETNDFLDSFRTDIEDSLIELQPRKHRKKKSTNYQQSSQTAILSLCLVTGLSAGVGHSFASGKSQHSTDASTMDPVPVGNQMKIETVAESSEMAQPYKKVPDIPAINQAPSTDHQIPAPKVESPSANEQEDQESSAKNVEKENTEEVDEKKEASDIKKMDESTEQQDTTPKNDDNYTVDKEKEDLSSESSSDQGQANKPSQNENQKDVTISAKEGKPLTDKSSLGGKLPQTAGEEPNQIVFGGVTAALGAALLAQRKRKMAKNNESS